MAKKTKIVAPVYNPIVTKTRNGWLILPGLRRLQPIPWIYDIPDL